MTPTQLQALTPADRRAIIAEAVNVMGLSVCRSCWNFIDPDCCGCGDAISAHNGYEGHSPIPMGCKCGYDKQPQPQSVPDYDRDLDACRLMEEALTEDDQRQRYAHTLYRSIIPENNYFDENEQLYRFVHATAEQKASAFLITQL